MSASTSAPLCFWLCFNMRPQIAAGFDYVSRECCPQPTRYDLGRVITDYPTRRTDHVMDDVGIVACGPTEWERHRGGRPLIPVSRVPLQCKRLADAQLLNHRRSGDPGHDTGPVQPDRNLIPIVVRCLFRDSDSRPVILCSEPHVAMRAGFHSGMNFNATPLMQYRSPVGGGPSGKTWPRWLPQRLQWTSVRIIPWLVSVSVSTAPGMGSLKLGQPVPLSNLRLDANSGWPQAAQ